MNMKDYEKRAEELTKEAKQLESTMLTYKALAYCTEHGHDWGGALHLTDDGTTVDGLCQNCAVRLTATNVTLQFDEANTEGFGELAGKVIEDIELPEEEPTPPTNPSETDEKPTLPVESKKETDGTYRVDVSHITGHTGDYIKGKTED
jgi:hypothetical protein|tara:strand:+ start:794 stop:1237 length:444 start_codon:yes stop_codon:yes gene_type:complete